MNRVVLASKLAKKDLKTQCRQRHLNPHSPKEKKWCDYCNAFAGILRKKTCECCENDFQRKLKYVWVAKILNKGLIIHNQEIMDWNTFPINPKVDKRWKEIPYGSGVYEIPIKYIALYGQNRADIQGVLKLAHKYLAYKGVRITIPDDEDKFSKCPKCQEGLQLDENGYIYCPKCVENNKHSQELM